MFNFLLLVSAIVFIVIDFVYLNVMKGYFDNQIKRVQGSPIKMNFLGAALCYILLINWSELYAADGVQLVEIAPK